MLVSELGASRPLGVSNRLETCEAKLNLQLPLKKNE